MTCLGLHAEEVCLVRLFMRKSKILQNKSLLNIIMEQNFQSGHPQKVTSFTRNQVASKETTLVSFQKIHLET